MYTQEGLVGGSNRATAGVGGSRLTCGDGVAAFSLRAAPTTLFEALCHAILSSVGAGVREQIVTKALLHHGLEDCKAFSGDNGEITAYGEFERYIFQVYGKGLAVIHRVVSFEGEVLLKTSCVYVDCYMYNGSAITPANVFDKTPTGIVARDYLVNMQAAAELVESLRSRRTLP